MKFFLLFAIVLVSVSSGNAQNRATYGESCNRTVRCDSRAFLTCANETCQCLKETEMVFDTNRTKCVVLAGERCMYTAMESEGDDRHERRWAEALDCIDNAKCNTDGYCGCQSESHESPEGQCIPSKFYWESCVKSEDCRTSDNLICVDGKCSCNATDAIYDDIHKMCIGKVGAHCRKYSRCVPNAYRESCGYGGNYDLCRCRNGFTKSLDGLCLGGYRKECDPVKAPCAEHFSCYGGHCACHFPDYQEYSERSGKCKSKLNGPCLETVKGKLFEYECLGEAECGTDPHNILYECVCKKGYIKSVDNICKKAHGNACARHDDCDAAEGVQLKCRDGVCSCRDFQVYDEQSSKCFGLVGARCSDELKCKENSYCQSQRNAPNSKSGICRCNSNALPLRNRKCVVPLVSVLANLTQAETETVGEIEEDAEDNDVGI